MKQLSLITFLIFVLGQACSPVPEKFNPSVGRAINDGAFGPRGSDSNVSFGQNQTIDSSKSQLAFSGEVETAEVMYLATRLYEMTDRTGNPEYAALADKLTAQFSTQSETLSSERMLDSHFLNAVMAEIEKGFKEALGDLDGQADAVVEILNNVLAKYSFKNKMTLADDAVDLLDEASAAVNGDPDLIDEVKDAVNEILDDYRVNLVPPTAEDYNDLIASNDPITMIGLIERALDRFNYELDGDTKDTINEVKPIANQVNSINNEPQQALTAIVMLWEFADDAQRRQFKDVNEELYDQLKDADRETLDCWKRNDFCYDLGFDVWFIEKPRKQILYVELEDYGLGKIKADLNEQLAEGIRSEVFALVDDLRGDLPDLLEEIVRDEFDVKVLELEETVADISSKLQPNIASFSTTNLKSDTFPLYEAETVNFSIGGSQSISINAIQSISSSNTSSKAFGYGLSALSKNWQNNQGSLISTADKSAHRRQVLGGLEKVFSMGGYTGLDGIVAQGIAQGVSNPMVDPYSLEDLSGLSYTYAIPDSFMVDGSGGGDQNVSVGHQAAVINGLVDMMDFLSDWNNNSFDDAFSSLKVSQILTTELADIAGDQGDQALFPKDQMYSLAVGQVAILLQGMELPGSPLVLFDGDEFVFVSGPSTFDQVDPIAVAATGYKNGQRDFRVNIRDLSDFLYALTRLHRALGDVGNSQSSILSDSSSGQSPIEQLTEAREGALRSLILGIANFIAGQAIEESGAVAEYVDLNGSLKVGSGQTVRTQVRAIRALVAASETLSTEIYTWSALDIYYNLNRTAWDSSINFYKLADPVDLMQISDSITALDRLMPYLNSQSQSQLDVIKGRWLEALRVF